MGYVTFPFPGLCNLVIRQFESWKLPSTGIPRVPNHRISSSQAKYLTDLGQMVKS